MSLRISEKKYYTCNAYFIIRVTLFFIIIFLIIIYCQLFRYIEKWSKKEFHKYQTMNKEYSLNHSACVDANKSFITTKLTTKKILSHVFPLAQYLKTDNFKLKNILF